MSVEPGGGTTVVLGDDGEATVAAVDRHSAEANAGVGISADGQRGITHDGVRLKMGGSKSARKVNQKPGGDSSFSLSQEPDELPIRTQKGHVGPEMKEDGDGPLKLHYDDVPVGSGTPCESYSFMEEDS